MSREKSDRLPMNRPRRRDRGQEDGWIRAFLHSSPFGALATVSEGQPFINTNIYAHDEARQAIYVHTAQAGRTRSNLERDERVCFSVSTMGRILPADTALEFSVEYAGVAVFGRGNIVEDDEEKSQALQLVLDKYAPHLRPRNDYRPLTRDERDRTSVFRIEIDSWSGKKKEAEPDFPGAFLYAKHD